METKRIFDDFQRVDCNDCAHYWDSSCDGVNCSVKGSSKPCTSFLATRSVVIPLQIKAIVGHLKWLYGVVILEAIAIVLLGVQMIG